MGSLFKEKIVILIIFIAIISSLFFFFPRTLVEYTNLNLKEYSDITMILRKRFYNQKANKSDSISITIDDDKIIQDTLDALTSNIVIKIPFNNGTIHKSGIDPVYMLFIEYKDKDKYEYIDIRWLDNERILIYFPSSQRRPSEYKFFPGNVKLSYIEKLFSN